MRDLLILSTLLIIVALLAVSAYNSHRAVVETRYLHAESLSTLKRIEDLIFLEERMNEDRSGVVQVIHISDCKGALSWNGSTLICDEDGGLR